MLWCYYRSSFCVSVKQRRCLLKGLFFKCIHSGSFLSGYEQIQFICFGVFNSKWTKITQKDVKHLLFLQLYVRLLNFSTPFEKSHEQFRIHWLREVPSLSESNEWVSNRIKLQTWVSLFSAFFPLPHGSEKVKQQTNNPWILWWRV